MNTESDNPDKFKFNWYIRYLNYIEHLKLFFNIVFKSLQTHSKQFEALYI